MKKVEGFIEDYIEGERKAFVKLLDVTNSNNNIENPSDYTKGIKSGLQLALTCFGHTWDQLEDIELVKFWSTSYKSNNK